MFKRAQALILISVLTLSVHAHADETGTSPEPEPSASHASWYAAVALVALGASATTATLVYAIVDDSPDDRERTVSSGGSLAAIGSLGVAAMALGFGMTWVLLRERAIESDIAAKPVVSIRVAPLSAQVRVAF